ncbi:CocE/NonD family hydrolase [Ascidiimonas aurantiaca]|uniref:CocE/NonD family hydrolase n=1 Tax=Ascidiimonas aurantiaca TaxID=1685432 RepID=UPI0030EC3E60
MKYINLLIVLFVLGQALGQAQDLETDTYMANSQSFYVPAVNGTQLAVDVYFPKEYQDQQLPALLEFTRYWRASEDPETGQPQLLFDERDLFFLANNYIIVKIDVRGTGASYGVRPGEYTPLEVRDARYIIDWVVNQSWSNGLVGAYGTSYSGTTAELLCATGHPAVKAVVPGWSDFNLYKSPVWPYGMLATGFIATWSQYVNLLDQNATEVLEAGVRRVTDRIPEEAIKEHANNPIVLENTRKAPYRDSKFGDYTYAECDPIYWRKEISESQVPMLVLTSWMDAGTAEGTLMRLKHFKNPQKVVMMATSHGGDSHASPFVVSDTPIAPVPGVQEQLQLQLDFFDHYLKNTPNGYEKQPTITYYNLGEETFKESMVWPPAGQSRKKWFLQANGVLGSSAPKETKGYDTYTVDFSASTGTHNRWATQMGKHVLGLNQRNANDSLLLTYTTSPLTKDLQITGTPVVSLQVSSTHKEGALFVYLETVDENGNSTYITEGGLLLEHRKLSKDPVFGEVPYHSFKKEDAAPMKEHVVEEITFKLWPTSVRIKKGHALRIAIAGADKDTFDRVPPEGTPTYSIFRNENKISFIDIPVIE